MKAQSQGIVCGMVGCELTTAYSLEGNASENKPRAIFAVWFQGSVKVVLKRTDYSEVSRKGSDPTWLKRTSLSVLGRAEAEVDEKGEGKPTS